MLVETDHGLFEPPVDAYWGAAPRSDDFSEDEPRETHCAGVVPGGAVGITSGEERSRFSR